MKTMTIEMPKIIFTFGKASDIKILETTSNPMQAKARSSQELFCKPNGKIDSKGKIKQCAMQTVALEIPKISKKAIAFFINCFTFA